LKNFLQEKACIFNWLTYGAAGVKKHKALDKVWHVTHLWRPSCVTSHRRRYKVGLNAGNAVLGKLAVNSLAVDAQKSGRFGLIAVCLFKGQENILYIRTKISF
jgi:hypothetical protein